MIQLQHRAGSLFEAKAGPHDVFVHACNARGVWGGGPGAVATQMRNLFPGAHAAYQDFCGTYKALGLGAAVVWQHYDFPEAVASLIVSNGYGTQKDAPNEILQHTRSSVVHLLRQLGPRHYHSPRINAGLFNVPWAHTEAVLREVLGEAPFDGTWTVWTP